MAMYVSTNVSSLNAQRNLAIANKSLDTSYTLLMYRTLSVESL